MRKKNLLFDKNGRRRLTYAFCGGAFGDEGKGRIVDMVVSELSKTKKVIVYRDNGGANAGHTIELADGQRVAFHQLPSGIFISNTTVVLGKGMVINPRDLIEELRQISQVKTVKARAKILIDELAVLSLDTHRAYESILKQWSSGGKGSTGRGISPAYADILLRHPLRVRDLINFEEEKIKQHYKLYAALIGGLGEKMAEVEVPSLTGANHRVGDMNQFVKLLREDAKVLTPYVKDLSEWLSYEWNSSKNAFVFEKSQAVGIDARWGVYPDVTASETTFEGIFSSTQGLVDPGMIEVRAGVIKATYMSSVGTRKLPAMMEAKMAERIREDAHEYGATTKRPRDIAYLDIPALSFFSKVGRLNSLVLTHMDISYQGVPIKVCTNYKLGSKIVEYQPDQDFLNKVRPVYRELPAWDSEKLKKAKSFKEIPIQAKKFIAYLSKAIGIPVIMITTGPKREQGFLIKNIF